MKLISFIYMYFLCRLFIIIHSFRPLEGMLVKENAALTRIHTNLLRTGPKYRHEYLGSRSVLLGDERGSPLGIPSSYPTRAAATPAINPPNDANSNSELLQYFDKEINEVRVNLSNVEAESDALVKRIRVFEFLMGSQKRTPPVDILEDIEYFRDIFEEIDKNALKQERATLQQQRTYLQQKQILLLSKSL